MGKSIRFHKRVQKRHTRKHKPTRKKNKMKKKYSKKQRGGNPLILWGSVGLGAIAALHAFGLMKYGYYGPRSFNDILRSGSSKKTEGDTNSTYPLDEFDDDDFV